ncbi:MAG TPA: D-2-hydroxyacid dehydrogenase [Actinophytocola sp.]|uniref:D-2-hydroxyacid dehydrogenase n=1 Tax=Actinophytocola sp. TaxID=1872138 RepID=UPI002DB6B6A7|nr:D-2-hydroxyacid dehydrogenase [Actinophytocola sp.]HEU5474159.1 D-2-hydroxyacid dehydrogenase [Actinophytocola sp.]
MQQPARPTVVVLSGADLPPSMAAIEQRALVRYATEEGLLDALPGADVLFVWRLRTRALTRAWGKADALRWVHTASPGPEQLLSPGVVASDVQVTTSRGLFDEPIAEYVLGLVLAFAKDLHGRIRLQQSRTWRQRETERVVGKHVLIAGTGSIARATGRTLRAAGMTVSAVGRVGRTGDPDLGDVLPLDRLNDGLRAADYVVLAAPLTDDTRGMIDGRALAAMKPSARIINVARGGLLVQNDLVAALRTGKIAGAALDVFRDEQLAESSPLWTLPNVLVSPHMSGQVVGWREELVALFADNLTRYLEGRALRNPVDKSRFQMSEA